MERYCQKILLQAGSPSSLVVVATHLGCLVIEPQRGSHPSKRQLLPTPETRLIKRVKRFSGRGKDSPGKLSTTELRKSPVFIIMQLEMLK